MARLTGDEIQGVQLDNAAGTPVDYTGLMIDPGEFPNPVNVVDTTVLTADESTARGGTRGGASGSMTFKLDDGPATGAGYKQLAAALATKTAKTITLLVSNNLSIAYEVIYTNLVPSVSRDEELTMVLSWQQTGGITVS
ncbi:MAG: hypothetical protein F4Z28_05070 [Gammaproteobacteria bacterium]|nr:hypothetical protein [Gammaproteobacteria bacterium]